MKWSGTERSNILWIATVFAVMGLAYVLLNGVGSRLLSGTRAYFAGQTQWTLAQKQASLALVRYVRFEDDAAWSQFLDYLKVIEGNKRGREMLDLEPPDQELSHNGFLAGKNNPRDIPRLIWIYEHFADFEPIDSAIEHWKEGERLVDDIRQIGEEFHQIRQERVVSETDRAAYLLRILELDREVSVVQDNFADAINRAAFKVEDFVYWITMGVMFCVGVLAAITIMYQAKNVRRWNEELQRKDRKFQGVLENSRDVIYQMNLKNGEYEYMSPGVKKMLGYTAEEIIEGGPDLMMELIHSDDLDRMIQEVEQLDELCKGKTEIPDTEFRIKTKHGNYIWINNKRSIVKTGENGEIIIIGNVRDITERKKYVTALDTSLKEKEMLLSEIHHRVKNNLSIISSLIELQKGNSESSNDKGFQEIQSRIKSIALVHEKLYQTETFADVDLAEYIHDLNKMIASTYYSADREILLTEELEPIVVNIIQAVPIGLICNELLNNCFKHAFKDKKMGEIGVILQESDHGKAALTVYDNGHGLPDHFDLDTQSSLGMTLLKALTQQVDGELSYDSKNGCRFTISFPV